MNKQTGAEERARAAQGHIDRSLMALKIILVIAIARLLVGPATEDLLGSRLMGLPTWEWSLCALTPPALLFIYRSPESWRLLSYDAIYVKSAAGLYLFYATAYVIFQGGWTLWIAVVASLAAFLGIWWLNRKERLSAR
ncbi:hypothetical protein STRCI_004711 [Streptomyces cinnabarinus]|uniref:DUF2568 domain-containing protein n=1 Tax=Streptomyces cinnabarinus TaxID=67287 RepID=A0ABY7KFQ6_9ACTN|nr:hypothetical protein [Streptomyces cinnabarinus]WAZ23372.1 hypothetical protein STRCI_004711 [Streptomyces cinnabarinus]